MISVIICSADKNVLEGAVNSIANTIGVEHEIITIANKSARLGICEAYNQGAAKARFAILCFMHEDVSFETPGWGHRVIAHLNNKEIGLIGVAGGDTKSLVPSSWPSSIFESEISLIQHYRGNKEKGIKIIMTGYPEDDSSCKNVACIDGVWMCTRKDVFNRHQFDQEGVAGFHGYDIDYSLQVGGSYRVCVIFDVLIHHYSEGSFSKAWMENCMLISSKWKTKLPYSVRPLSRQEFIRQHWTSMNIFIDTMFELEYNLFFIVSKFLQYAATKWFHYRYFIHSFKKILMHAISRN